jgi:hypothetical protein
MEIDYKKDQYLSILGLIKNSSTNEKDTSLTDSNSDDEKYNKNLKKRAMKPKSRFVYSVPFSFISLKEKLLKQFYGSINRNEKTFDASFEVLKRTDYASFDYERYCSLSKLELENKRKMSKSNNNLPNSNDLSKFYLC